MFRLLSLTTTGYSETILRTVLRWIVLVEVFQNAWSFSVFSQLQRGGGPTFTDPKREQGSEREAVKKSSHLPYPWRSTSERDHNDEHRLEDIFLDEVSEAGGPDDNYHFEDGTFQYLEEEALNDSFVARNLETYDEDMNDGERSFPCLEEDH